MKNSPLQEFQQELDAQVKDAWERVLKLKQTTSDLYDKLTAWRAFRNDYHRQLLPVLEQRRKLEHERQQLLLRIRQASQAAVEREAEAMITDDPLSPGEQEPPKSSPEEPIPAPPIALDPPTGVAPPGPPPGTPPPPPEPPQQEENLQPEKTPDPRRIVARHFYRIYKTLADQEARNASFDTENEGDNPFSNRLSIVADVVNDPTCDEVDILVRVPFDKKLDAVLWWRALTVNEYRRAEHDAERLYRFKLWAKLLEIGEFRLRDELAGIETSALYDDFERWRTNAKSDAIDMYLKSVEVTHTDEIDQLRDQIKRLTEQLTE